MAAGKTFLARLAANRRGNVAMIAAGALPLVAGSLALAVDYGKLTLERRTLQQHADLAAIIAASNAADRMGAVRHYLASNSLDYVIAIENGFVDTEGKHLATVPDDRQGILRIEPGVYLPSSELEVGARFRAVDATATSNAARVEISRPGTLHFAALFSEPPRLSAVGTAHASAQAAFSIGSRLASLNDGIANQVLGAMFGSRIDLKLMDYNALASADISLLAFMDALATNLSLDAVTYDELLNRSVSIGRMATVLSSLEGLSPQASAALRSLVTALGTKETPIALSAFLDAGPVGRAAVGAAQGLAVKANALDFLSAMASIAGAGRQIALHLDQTLPGLASVSLKLAVGQPPAGSAWIAIGERGATVRTAQTRLALDVKVLGTGAISALHVPLYLEVAYGEATLSAIDCGATRLPRSVTLDARPGVLEAAIGKVTASSFTDFTRAPTVAKASLVDLLLLKVKASAHLEVANIDTTALRFSGDDIARGATRTVDTRDLTRSLTLSLLERLQLEVDILGLGLGIGNVQAVTKLVTSLLEGVSAPLDEVLHSTLRSVGVSVGEADVRVTGAECNRAVLVQ
ncbi:hypothetical protein D5400_08940 [Georhizobium profundi]|uniref:Putative Flp pilus-assembly TadG-like N-terminal domain-containing protein n=1 Tax=Georhizobium profundi TaxID=2341112 RepID=A0A3Q8XN17_9HYPH|nr:pilus assembly protein TadG-related protein [Georhizobium profundi]AZN71379.1 hypothetical protein D5400_08940 [Georhizobium profundi]